MNWAGRRLAAAGVTADEEALDYPVSYTHLLVYRGLSACAGLAAARTGAGRGACGAFVPGCVDGPVRRLYFPLRPGERQRVWRGGHVAAVHGLFCADRCACLLYTSFCGFGYTDSA